MGVGWGTGTFCFWPQACASNDEDSPSFSISSFFVLSTIHQVRLQEIGSQNRQVDTQKDKIRRLETQLKEARGTMEKQVQAMDTLFGKTQKLAEDLDTQMIANDGVTKELHRMQGTLLSEFFSSSSFTIVHSVFNTFLVDLSGRAPDFFLLLLWQSLTPFPLRLLTGELKKKDTEIANLANDNNGIKRRVDKEKKKVVIMQQRVADAKQARDMVVVELTQTQKDLEVARRREDGLSKNIESLNGRLEVKDRAVAREVDKTKAQSDLVVMEQRKVKALEDGKERMAKEPHVSGTGTTVAHLTPLCSFCSFCSFFAVYCYLCTVYCLLLLFTVYYCLLFITVYYCLLCTVYCVLCTVYCVLCTLLFTVYCSLFTVHCLLSLVHLFTCSLVTVVSALFLGSLFLVPCSLSFILCRHSRVRPGSREATQTDLPIGKRTGTFGVGRSGGTDNVFFFFSKVAGKNKEIKRKNCDSHLSSLFSFFSFFSFFSLSLLRTTQVEVRYQKVCEEVKLKEMQITDMGKKVTESEQKLKQQQQLYEAVRSDRNLYSKNLIESQDEIAEMKRKFKIMSHQIEQLKGTGAAWSCCWSVSLLFTILDRYLWIGVVDRCY